VKILVVSSVGGHLTEIMQLAPVLRDHEVTLVVNDEAQLPDFPFRRVYRIAHAERDWRVLYNLLEAAVIVHEEQPDVVLSAGAGPAVPVALVAKLFAHARVVFIESAAAVVRPTLTGRMMYPLADEFFYQWPALAAHYPRGELVRLVIP
jgi:UDP-N-acetylglucosamine:LPS N-acetylglucosamine transferase